MLVAGFTACTAGEPRQSVPLPQLGSVIGAARRCTGTRIAEEEVLTAASCVAGARAADLQFVPRDDGAAVHVRWVIAGQELDSSGMDDWAILALEQGAPTRDLNARHVWPNDSRPAVGTPLWWAAVTADGGGIASGLCRVQGLVQVAERLDFDLVDHDCALTGSAPGVLLYDLDEHATPRAIAFQGTGKLAVTIDAFSEIPVPAVDLFFTFEAFVGIELPTLLAVDQHGRVSHRRNLEGVWLNWTNAARLPRPAVRVDGVARSHDFLGPQLERVWLLDEMGELYSYSFGDQRLRSTEPFDGDNRAGFVDLSVALTPQTSSAVFAVTREGTLCARPDTTRDAAWSCTDVGMGVSALDATHMAGGYLVVAARDSTLTAVAFTDGVWQAPFELATDGGHRHVTASTTPQGTLYVVTTLFERLRVRVGDPEAETWSDWAPLHAGNLPDAVTALESGSDHFEHEVVYAVAGGEILTSRELTQASLDRWLAQATSPPEFGGWQRLRGVNHLQP